MKKFVLWLFCMMLIASIQGCETFKGFAKDVENTADNIWEVFTKD